MSDRESAVYPLLSAATAPVTGGVITVGSDARTIQAAGSTSAGVGAATVLIEATNDLTMPWLLLATITLTLGPAATSDGFLTSATWANIRARLTAISGTNASVSANVGV